LVEPGDGVLEGGEDLRKLLSLFFHLPTPLLPFCDVLVCRAAELAVPWPSPRELAPDAEPEAEAELESELPLVFLLPEELGAGVAAVPAAVPILLGTSLECLLMCCI
jgi:hypothetical protein